MNSINNMPPAAKVWVYQSKRTLSANEIELITSAGREFIAHWSAHGAGLKASIDIFYNRFIVIAVDEQQTMASGCSQDTLLKFIKSLDEHFNLLLLDRMQVAYRKGDDIETCKLGEFEKLATEGLVNSTTIVFNNMVTTKFAFDNEWEVPVAKSWHSRVL